MSSRVKIRGFPEKAEKFPLGWATDIKGIFTTDPIEALKGFDPPVGSRKGYGLAIAIDVLCCDLTRS